MSANAGLSLELLIDPGWLMQLAIRRTKLKTRVHLTKKSPNRDRGRLDGHNRLMGDYFCDNPTYNDREFRRRFRVTKTIFFRLRKILLEKNKYFVQVRSN